MTAEGPGRCSVAQSKQSKSHLQHSTLYSTPAYLYPAVSQNIAHACSVIASAEAYVAPPRARPAAPSLYFRQCCTMHYLVHLPPKTFRKAGILLLETQNCGTTSGLDLSSDVGDMEQLMRRTHSSPCKTILLAVGSRRLLRALQLRRVRRGPG